MEGDLADSGLVCHHSHGLTLESFALLADTTFRLDLFDVFGREGNLARRAAHVDVHLADLLGSGFGVFEERRDVTAHCDHKSVHRIARSIPGTLDVLDDVLEQLLDFRKIQVFIGSRGNDPGIRGPTCRGQGVGFRFDPLHRQAASVLALGCHPRNRVLRDDVPRSFLGPGFELSLGHLRAICNESGEVHRIAIPGFVKLASQCLVPFDFLGDHFEVRDFDSEMILRRSVAREGFSSLCASFFLQLVHDFGNGFHEIAPTREKRVENV